MDSFQPQRAVPRDLLTGARLDPHALTVNVRDRWYAPMTEDTAVVRHGRRARRLEDRTTLADLMQLPPNPKSDAEGW